MHPIHVQLGLFGGFAEVAGMHVVAAHVRELGDGTQVFVSEHLRWDRGRQPRRPSAPRARAPAAESQPTLFAPRPGPEMEEVEVFPGAYQLPLWRS